MKQHLDALKSTLDEELPAFNEAIEAAGASGILLPDRAAVRSQTES